MTHIRCVFDQMEATKPTSGVWWYSGGRNRRRVENNTAGLSHGAARTAAERCRPRCRSYAERPPSSARWLTLRESAPSSTSSALSSTLTSRATPARPLARLAAYPRRHLTRRLSSSRPRRVPRLPEATSPSHITPCPPLRMPYSTPRHSAPSSRRHERKPPRQSQSLPSSASSASTPRTYPLNCRRPRSAVARALPRRPVHRRPRLSSPSRRSQRRGCAPRGQARAPSSPQLRRHEHPLQDLRARGRRADGVASPSRRAIAIRRAIHRTYAALRHDRAPPPSDAHDGCRARHSPLL
ncbi:hypothetical protein DFH06DRAFT_273169 [Mycena polygramma]|nr:hypothetical protein DFH06DRAFT_273169 [Mycena polygramma]